MLYPTDVSGTNLPSHLVTDGDGGLRAGCGGTAGGFSWGIEKEKASPSRLPFKYFCPWLLTLNKLMDAQNSNTLSAANKIKLG